MTLYDYFDAYAADYAPYKGGRWCYEDGLLYLALVRLHHTTGDDRWLSHLIRLTDAQISADGAILGYDVDEYNIDNILSGRCLFYLAKHVDTARYMSAAQQLMTQLQSHPRLTTGNYWHKQRYPHQVWLDGLFMALPFQVEFGLMIDDNALIDDAIDQLRCALALTQTPEGLYVHGYDHSHNQTWSNPENGQSPAVWARAVGWLAMALVDLVDLLGDDPRSPKREATRLMNTITAQQRDSGLWQQVMAMPDLPGNYEESSASAMFAYALMKSARLGLTQTADAGQRSFDALCTNKLRVIDGRQQFDDVCCVAGLGGFDGVYRDGTPAYYLSEAIKPDDIKGVGPLAYALCEAEMKSAKATPIAAVLSASK